MHKSGWANHEGDLQDRPVKCVSVYVCVFKGMPRCACVPMTIQVEKNKDKASILWKVHS